MPHLRTCAQQGCGRPTVHGSWCWACSHERETKHTPLELIDWDADCD